ncbi:MAG: hypothetical protein VB070_15115 [Clostridiaceae bacterium]|nr:hypothetical protein [Clostridiaceae bacterium]
MLISIWGRDGSGKSTLADYLGSQISKTSLAAVIDTDLTQPTLPVRLPGVRFVKEKSLGRAISGAGTQEIKRYLHQDPKNAGLFYAGLLNGDDYLAYEIGLEAETAADLFVKNCSTTVDHVILDCSGQRTDPFVPLALKDSDHILILLTPDLQGICWWQSVEPLLKQLNALSKIQLVLSPVQRHHQESWIQESLSSKVAAALPFDDELNILRCSGQNSGEAIMRSGRAWCRVATELLDRMCHTGSDA